MATCGSRTSGDGWNWIRMTATCACMAWKACCTPTMTAMSMSVASSTLWIYARGDGNIDAEYQRQRFARNPGWMLRTGDGNMHLRLPGNFAADISGAHTGDGSVRVDFPMTTSGSTD